MVVSQFGARKAKATKKLQALFSPNEIAVRINLHSVCEAVVIGKTTHHAAIGGGGHSDTFRHRREFMSADMNAIVAPLRNTFKVDALQSGRPTIGVESFPLDVGVTGVCVGGEIDFTVVIAAVGDESVGGWVVDPLCLQCCESE